MKIYLADAFAERKYGGNPAAVCLPETERSAEWMQQIANEMNQAETAFLKKEGDAYNLRWFTPQAEVDLCGHATLAAAHILWETAACREDLIRFATRSGELTAERAADGRIRMNFPAEEAAACEPPEGLEEILGCPVRFVGKNRMDYLVETDNEDTLRSLSPDFSSIRQWKARGVIVTSVSANPAYDFASRCFYPAVGIDEDPVTGSAHCALAPYWGEKLGKSKLSAMQASARTGMLELELRGSRVWITGRAVTTLSGELV